MRTAGRLERPRRRHRAARSKRGVSLTRALRWSLIGPALALALGCGSNGTTGPRQPGLTVDAQELIPGDGGCRLRATLRNRTGADISGQLVYNLLDAARSVIGAATVFPEVPDNTTRFATSDLLASSVDGHRLACTEIAFVQINTESTTVPLALG